MWCISVVSVICACLGAESKKARVFSVPGAVERIVPWSVAYPSLFMGFEKPSGLLVAPFGVAAVLRFQV